MAGQVNPGSGLGDKLYELARLPEVEIALEVGTWNGEGSTLCLARGLSETSGRLYSIELDTEMYLKAVAFYSDKDLPVEIINGFTLSPEAFEDYEVYRAGGEATVHEKADPGLYRRWYAQELDAAKNAPEQLVLNRLVNTEGRFDLVLLDGGEFTSHSEFEFLEPFIDGYIVLDDTNPVGSIKSAASRTHILASRDWTVLHDEFNDRFGWLVARKNR